MTRLKEAMTRLLKTGIVASRPVQRHIRVSIARPGMMSWPHLLFLIEMEAIE